MLKIKEILDNEVAVTKNDGDKIGNLILEKYNDVVELDFTDIVAVNTAFFNGMIFVLVQKYGWDEFVQRKLFKLLNAKDNFKNILASSMDLADSHFNG